MKKRTLTTGIIVLLLLVVGGIVGGWYFLRPQKVPELSVAEPVVRSIIVDQVIAAREREIAQDPTISFGSQDEINILALGIDSRKEGEEQHCDAIHMVTLNIREWTINITSVPRGTYAKLPPGREYKDTDYYMANACAFGGLEYGIDQIEDVIGFQHDYVATVGFSQALGIFRTLGLPTTETLQWLRHRQSYQIGDPQRSQNQATFMKDIALRLSQDDGISTPLLYILYTLVDTDLTFEQIQAIYIGYLASDIGSHPERITFDMKPFFETKEYHFDLENPDEQIESLLKTLQGRLSREDLSNRSLEEIQEALIDYLYDALADEGTVEHVYAEQLWRQVEDEQTREELHFRFLEKYVREFKDEDREKAVQAVTDYILEKHFFGLAEWEEKGRKLLGTLVDANSPSSVVVK